MKNKKEKSNKNKKDHYVVSESLKRMRYKKLARDILKAIGLGVAIVFVLSSPQGTRKLFKGLKDEWDGRSAKDTLERLRERKLVAFQEQEDGSFQVVLTKEGKQKIEEWNIDDLQLAVPKRWDGRWRIVAFDISEKRKKAREALRQTLKRLGFFQLQKSVFVHPYPCEAEIRLLKSVFSILDYEVLYFSTDVIPQEKHLKRHFQLV